MALLSLKDAAAAVGKDPSTLTRAVKKGDLSASNDPRTGNRQFETSELIRVFGALKPVEPAAPTVIDDNELQRLRARIEELQLKAQELEDLRRREVSDARAERDRWAQDAQDWKRMAQEASERIPQLLLEYKKSPSPDASTLSSERTASRRPGILRWFS